MSDIVNKLWGFCHVLRHDGASTCDSVTCNSVTFGCSHV